MRIEGHWQPVSWEAALEAASALLRDALKESGAERIGFLASPSSTNEEAYLLGRLARGLGSHNVDSRLRQLDFSDQARRSGRFRDSVSACRTSNRSADCCWPAVTSATKRRSSRTACARPRSPAARSACCPRNRSNAISRCCSRLVAGAADLATELAALANGGGSSDARRAIVESLSSGRAAIVLGGVAMRHTHYADLRAAAATLAAKTGASLGFLPDGGNAVGTALAGALPHRLPGGQPDPAPGLDLRGMLESPLAACILFGGIEPAEDIGLPGATQALANCRRVIAMTPVCGSGRHEVCRDPAADRHVRRNLGQLRELRGPLAGIPRLRPAGRRGAPGLEGPARAGEPTRDRGLQPGSLGRCTRGAPARRGRRRL